MGKNKFKCQQQLSQKNKNYNKLCVLPLTSVCRMRETTLDRICEFIKILSLYVEDKNQFENQTPEIKKIESI